MIARSFESDFLAPKSCLAYESFRNTGRKSQVAGSSQRCPLPTQNAKLDFRKLTE
jgi:hypothetical protein